MATRLQGRQNGCKMAYRVKEYNGIYADSASFCPGWIFVTNEIKFWIVAKIIAIYKQRKSGFYHEVEEQ